MMFELFENSKSIVLPARCVGQSYCCIRKWSMARLYSADTISFSSVVAPDLHCPVIQSACGRLKSPIITMSGVGEGRDTRNFLNCAR